MTDFTVARRNMVDCQLRPNEVADLNLVAAILDVPRERFVPLNLQGVAYIDEDLALGNGRYVMEPMVFGRLMQLAEIKPDDVVLVIGCGTGYSAAVLGRLAGTVVALESDPTLAETATALLAELGCDNVAVVGGPLEAGCPTQAPFDVIFIDGAVAAVPAAITDQLKEDGRLVTVLAGTGRVGHGVVMIRCGDFVGQRTVFDAATPLLPDFAPKEEFVF
ncbi:MAG: protein-L-isoaspartate O-methyltransferase [Alphaproteobacteria bacterium]|nr:protein-L-isoaspartate O-methyltransferase [Alphaproteobacteria bacterium]